MEVSIVELRRRMKEVFAAMDRDGSVTITFRGKARARLVPAGEPSLRRRSIRDYPAFGIWEDREDMCDVAAYVREIRRDRLDALR